MRWMKRIAIGLAVLAVLYGAFVGSLFAAMKGSPASFNRFMARMPMVLFPVLPFRTLWYSVRAGVLQPGDAAPEFALAGFDGATRVTLSELRGKPVVLVFGSYT
jgi:hypothetical protein